MYSIYIERKQMPMTIYVDTTATTCMVLLIGFRCPIIVFDCLKIPRQRGRYL